MNEENNLEVIEGTSSLENETFETVGVSEQLFINRMNTFEDILTVHTAGLAFIVGCILALIVVEVFKRV